MDNFSVKINITAERRKKVNVVLYRFMQFFKGHSNLYRNVKMNWGFLLKKYVKVGILAKISRIFTFYCKYLIEY